MENNMEHRKFEAPGLSVPQSGSGFRASKKDFGARLLNRSNKRPKPVFLQSNHEVWFPVNRILSPSPSQKAVLSFGITIDHSFCKVTLLSNT